MTADTAAGSPVLDPDRLAAVARTGLLDTAPEPAFDELAAMAAQLLHAPFAFVTLMDDTRSFWKARIGIPAGGPTQNTVEESFCRYVVATGEPLIVGDTAAEPLTADNPSIASMGVRAWAGYPLRSPDGHALGSFCVVDTVVREWSAGDVETLRVLSEAAGRELALRASIAAAEHSNGQLALLAEVGRSLSETLDAGEAADRLSRLVLPTLGDWSVVSLVDEAEASTDVAWAHVRPEMLPALDAFAGERVGLDDLGATAGGGRSGQPVVLDGAAIEAGLSTLQADRAGNAFRTLDPGAYGVWPLTSGPTAHGVLVIARDAGRPGFTPAEIDLATNIAQHAGTVIHNVRLYEREQLVTDELAAVARQLQQASEHDRVVARALQQAMLTTLPQPDHLQLAARYLTADGYDQVGGDWYDALLPPDGATTLMIGDVMGHDIAAATVMGQLRNLLRAIAWEHDAEPPSALITRLDRVAVDLGLTVMTTLVVARIEPAAAGAHGVRTLTWSTAGHPPPVLIDGKGRARLLATAVDPPLAVLPGVARRDHRAVIGPGETLLLYTDGLIETRRGDLTDRQADLVDGLGRHAELGLEQLLDAVLATMVGERPDDDVALVAVRLHPEDEAGSTVATVGLPSTLDAPTLARRFVVEHGDRLPTDVLEDALLLVSELASNAVRHGGPAVELVVRTTPTTLRLEVSDQGVDLPTHTAAGAGPVPPGATSGRGLAIVDALVRAWGIVPADPRPGKTVWVELDAT